MHDVWKPTLIDKIDAFMSRKDREFPELKLSKKWYDYEIIPKTRRQDKIRKLSTR